MGRKGKYKPPKKDTAAPAPAGDVCPFVSRGGLKLRRALDVFGMDATGLWCADLGCSTGGFTDCLLQAGAARVYAVDTAYGELAWAIRTDERVVVMERTNAVHATAPDEVVDRGGVDLVVIDLGWTAQAKAIPAALGWVAPRDGDTQRGPGASLGSPTPARGAPDERVTENARREPGLAPGPCPEGASNEPEAPAKDERTKNPSLALQARYGALASSSAGRIISLIKPHYEVAKDELGEGGVLDPARAQAVTDEVCGAMPGLGVRVLDLVESPVLGGKKKGKGTGNREWLVLLEPLGSG